MEQFGVDTGLAQLRQAQLNTQRMDRLSEAAKHMDMKQIDQASQDFEASFLTEMMRPMFDGIKPDSMFGGGKGEQIFQGMMIDQYGKIMAERGGVGIAAIVKDELVKIQEQAQKKHGMGVDLTDPTQAALAKHKSAAALAAMNAAQQTAAAATTE